MCSMSRPIRSISRLRCKPTVGILLNVTRGPSRPPRHDGELRRHQGAACRRKSSRAAPRSIGVDDDYTRAAAERIAARRQECRARLGASGVCATAISPRARASCARRRQGRAGRGARRHRLAARRAQCAERRLRGCAACVALGLDLPRDSEGPRAVSPAWPTACSRSAARATCCSSTIRRRPMPTPPPRRWPAFNDIYWIAGGKPKTGGIAQPRRILPAHPQGLSDRRGGGGIRRRRSKARCLTRSPARLTARSTRRPATPAPRRLQGAGRAAVAGLRLVRPVSGISRCAATAFPRASCRARITGVHRDLLMLPKP